MQIQINFGDMSNSDAIENHIHDTLHHELRHTGDRVTRVEVHLRDDKQKRSGPDDVRCTMEARIAGEQPLAVDDKGRDMYKVISSTADKLASAVNRKIGKREG